jgi:hypothetical protein
MLHSIFFESALSLGAFVSPQFPGCGCGRALRDELRRGAERVQALEHNLAALTLAFAASGAEQAEVANGWGRAQSLWKWVATFGLASLGVKRVVALRASNSRAGREP